MKEAPTRAVLTALVGALVAAAALAPEVAVTARYGELPVVAVAVVMALVIAVGWPVLLGLPHPLGSGAVIALGGVGATIAVTATRGQPFLRELPLVVALTVLLAFVNELARQDGRARLVDSVAGTVSGVLIATAAAGWVAAERAPSGTAMTVSGAVALSLAAAVSAVPLAGPLGAGVTTGAAVLGGASVAAVMPDLNLLVGVVLGLATGLLIAALHVLFYRLPALRFRLAALSVIVLPVSMSGILVYVVGRVFAS